MSQVYCFTHVWEDFDEDEGEVENSTDIYIFAENYENALPQIRDFLGPSARVYHNTIGEHEWTKELAQECIRSMLYIRSDDNLFLLVLQKYPHFVDADLIGKIFNENLPQSFEFALNQCSLEDCDENWLFLSAQYQDEKALTLLLEKGLRDNGRGLAQVCDEGNRELFELLYSKSNPQAALQHTNGANLHWIEEQLAAEQKQRLEQEVSQPSRCVQRKM